MCNFVVELFLQRVLLWKRSELVPHCVTLLLNGNQLNNDAGPIDKTKSRVSKNDDKERLIL